MTELPAVALLGALLTGTLIGAVGVGGVLLASILVLSGVGLHEATAAASCSFFFAGLVGTSLYARHGSMHWPLARGLLVGLAPAALLGAVVNARFDTSTLGVALALLIPSRG